jgi:squalene cyclase
MADTIKAGTILIAEGALLPESLLLESEPYAYGWRLVKNLDSNGLDQIISQAGWNFFYIAGVIETNAFGSDENKTTRKAIKQVIANLKSKNFNCLEIKRVVAMRSLGLPYMSVSAHSRHIQKSQALSGD